MIQPYRYRCSMPERIQYVSYQQLGNRIEECLDGSDELSREIHWQFFSCHFEDDFACWFLRHEKLNEVQLLFHHHCDSVWDVMDGEDERNCSYWVCTSDMYQCPETGQCINRAWICDGEFDCANGADELNCSLPKSYWIEEDKCDRSLEHFCITKGYLSNQLIHRPCINYSKAGDGAVDCMGGRDERNTALCADYRILGNRFTCDNMTKCIDSESICNGIIDCFDRTDELICSWNRQQCRHGQFACKDLDTCIDHRCDPKENCSFNEHLFWCSSATNSSATYRQSKIRRTSEYLSFCNRFSNVIASSATAPIIDDGNQPVINVLEFCNRGFYLSTNNGTGLQCFCPPSYYGDQCQYTRRRATVLVQFDRRHRSDIPSALHVIVSLVYNHSSIVDQQAFVDVDEAFPIKHHIYLLYPRPHVKGSYSIRFEAYNGTYLLSMWNYPIGLLDFLPVFRLAKILRFPDEYLPRSCAQNHCENSGTCFRNNQNISDYMCLCQRGWYGEHCEEQLLHTNCASHALARDRNLCVCPYTYLLPHCYIRNTICERSKPWSDNEICYPLSVLPPNQFECLCTLQDCNRHNPRLVLQGRERNDQSFLLQLLKFSSSYPRLRQQLLIQAKSKFPIERVINTWDSRSLSHVVPEVGLLYTFERRTESVEMTLHLLYVNCTNKLLNVSIDLDTQLRRCHSLDEDAHGASVKLYHTFCRQLSFRPCFYSKNYVCYCNEVTNRSECLSYRQRSTACSHCINRGRCIQGDLQNRSDFMCICPQCVTGFLCQFSSIRFSISLEILIERTAWHYRHFIGPVIFLLIGGIFNGLSMTILVNRKIRQTGVGLYLFLNAITSQLVLILLCTRVTYLVAARQVTISPWTNKLLCKSQPYLMSSLYYLSQWFTAFVTVARAFTASSPVRFRCFGTSKSARTSAILISLFIFATFYRQIVEYKIVVHPHDSHPWCVQEINPADKRFVQYTALAHQITPFAINFTATVLIIVAISRSKAAVHHLNRRSALIQQARRQADLLIGPLMSFLTQLPQLIILFLNACDYEQSTWFVQLTLVFYYISFIPQMSLFFIYILPSSLYKQLLRDETNWFKCLTRLLECRRSQKHVIIPAVSNQTCLVTKQLI